MRLPRTLKRTLYTITCSAQALACAINCLRDQFAAAFRIWNGALFTTPSTIDENR